MLTQRGQGEERLFIVRSSPGADAHSVVKDLCDRQMPIATDAAGCVDGSSDAWQYVERPLDDSKDATLHSILKHIVHTFCACRIWQQELGFVVWSPAFMEIQSLIFAVRRQDILD